MADVEIKVDTGQVKKLGADFHDAAEIGLRRVVERGEQLLHEEAPKQTHNLEQGISSEVDGEKLEGQLIISARSGRRASRKATLHLVSGKTRSVSLRATPAYNYAGVVATGKPAQLSPKGAKAFLIPVESVRAGEAYIEEDGQMYVVRRSIRAVPPNPYDERAMKRLEPEIPAIMDKTFSLFFE